jgi:hypothetical protein
VSYPQREASLAADGEDRLCDSELTYKIYLQLVTELVEWEHLQR